MAVPRAAPTGAFGSGYEPAPIHPIDIAGAIEAASSGASTLIQNAYTRKLAARNMALQEQREQREATYQSGVLNLERLKATRQAKTEGITPAPGEPGADEPYDPNKSLPYLRSVVPAQIRGDATTDAATIRAQAAKDLEDQKAANRAKLAKVTHDFRSSEIGQRIQGSKDVAGIRASAPKNETPQAKLNRLNKLADNIVQASGGDPGAIDDFLQNDPEGKAAASEGLGHTHIGAAIDRYRTQQGNVNARIQGQFSVPGEGGGPPTPEQIDARRRALRVPGGKPAAGAAGKRAAWVQQNPPKAGESKEDYLKRVDAAVGALPKAP